jgi:hypothetical protein
MYDANEHTKEVYAHFGLAYYLASVFETGVTHAILCLDFLHQQAELRRQRLPFDRAKFEADFDQFLVSQNAQTLGNLLKRLGELVSLADDQKALLVRAKKRRDFIAHHFFRDRAAAFVSRKGRDEMLAELASDESLFEDADEIIQTIVDTQTASLGLPTAVLEFHARRYLDAIPREE